MALQTTINYDKKENFEFDSSLVEVPNGGPASLKDQRPTNATFYADFESDINGNWGDGTLTGTAFNSASVESGFLSLLGEDEEHVDWDADSNADSQQVGTVKFTVVVGYSGSPTNNQHFWLATRSDADSRNLIAISHKSDGNLNVLIHSSTDTPSSNDLGAWSPDIGTEYEIELNWDFDTGATRLFIDGVQFGSTISDTLTRDGNISLMRVGNDFNKGETSDFKIGSLLIYSTVQHTSDYSSGESISSTIYSTANPTVTSKTNINLDEIISFSETSSIAGSDAIKYILTYDNQDKYWDGAAWVDSDGTYSQSNTASEISTNASSLDLSEGGNLKLKSFLHSDDGSTEPTLTSVVVGYNFSDPAPTDFRMCKVKGYIRDIENQVIDSATIKVRLAESVHNFKPSVNLQVLEQEVSVKSTSTGLWELELIRSSEFDPDIKYDFEITGDTKNLYREITVPDSNSVDFKDIQ